MKIKIIRAVVLLTMSALLLTGCSPIVKEPIAPMSVWTTFYPIYALTSMLTDGADVEVHCLVQPQDECLRSYKMSDWDLYMLAYSADLILAAGNGLESFSDKLAEIGENAIPTAEVVYGLELYQMDDGADEESHFSGENPHLYMSIESVLQIAENIESVLSLINAAETDVYKQNLVLFAERVQKLREYIKKQTEVCDGIAAAVLHENLFYTARDCGLEIKTWYERESGEMLYGNAMDECLQRLKENAVQVVLIENQAPAALAETLERAGFRVIRLNVMSTLSENDGAQVFFDVLKDNADAVAAVCSGLND